MVNKYMSFNRTLLASTIALALGSSIALNTSMAADGDGGFKSSVEYGSHRGDTSTYSLRASDIVGADVINSEDEEIGSIDDLVLKKDGAQIMAIISVGGFLGIGDKLVAVPYNELRIGEGGKQVYLSATKAGLEARPSFEYLEGEEYGQDRMAARSERSELVENVEGDNMANEAAMTDDKASGEQDQMTDSNDDNNELKEAWAKVKSEWSDIKASAKEQWDKLTDEDLDTIEGDREQLVDRLGNRYEKDRSEAEREADRWARTQ